MKKKKWIKRGKSLPDKNRIIECKHEDGEIITGRYLFGQYRPLFEDDFVLDTKLKYWRYAH